MSSQWLLFLPQLPSSPSSLRVFVWRRVRAAGALGLQNGVWILPDKSEHQNFMNQLLAEVRQDGGQGFIFTVTSLDESAEVEIVERFRLDRDAEYAEFCERCEGFLQEIEKETGHQKFTFAELEENEQDLHKLEDWLRKIQARDFFQGRQAGAALVAVAQCREALNAFTQAVYINEGLDEATSGTTP